MTYDALINLTKAKGVSLVAVSKTKPISDILDLYNKGQRIFGENKVQEILEKYSCLPTDIEWHMIGHLQKNKVKQIVPIVSMIQSVDSEELLTIINKECISISKKMNGLLEIKIATEESKYGLGEIELSAIINRYVNGEFPNINIKGLMGMASFVDEPNQIKLEFSKLKSMYDSYKMLVPSFDTLSMGMSGDYKIAMECGSNMIRIGNLLFGARQ